MAIEEIKFKRSKETKEKKSRFVGKMFEKKADKWEEADWEKILDVSLKTILDGDLRFIVELTIDGQQMFIATHIEDEEALHAKHPTKVVVNLKQLYKFLRKSATNERWLELLPRVFVALNTFGGGEVIT